MTDTGGGLMFAASGSHRFSREGVQGRSVSLWSGAALCLAVAIILSMPTLSWAHGFAGKRFFPTTFQVDDPFIGDEFSILINSFKGPDAKTTEIDIDYSKRIVPNFGLEFHEVYEFSTYEKKKGVCSYG
jgi:hypothetical protein